MALVLLPCDLPTWPTLQRHLTALRSARTSSQFREILLKIYNLCNTSLEPDDEALPDQSVFDLLFEMVDNCLTAEERLALFDTQLPIMVDYALQLKSLKPPRGIHYSLQQQSDRVEIDRRLAASLLAHAFFSTFPRRTAKTHPTLQDFNFAGHFFHHLHRRSQRVKLRSILHYFQRLGEEPPEGRVTFARQVMSGREWCTLEEWLQCRRPLCPLVVRHDGNRVEPPDGAPPNGLRICFANRQIGGAFLDDGASQECAAFCSHPELLSLLPFVESLEDNEALTASGLGTYSIIHDLKNKAVADPAPTTSETGSSTSPTSNNNNNNAPQQETTAMCLLDAEDYSDLPIRQYEEDNVLRELNKAYLGFSQHQPQEKRQQQQQQQVEVMEKRLPPVGASRDSSPSRRAAANNSTTADDQRRDDWSRSATLVSSDTSKRPSFYFSSSSTTSQEQQQDDDAHDERRRSSTTALLYGGGRNVPLTLTNATAVIKEMPQLPPMLLAAAKRAGEGSIYASCDSQHNDINSSTEEFRSAHTSLDEEDPPKKNNRHNSNAGRPESSPCDSGSDTDQRRLHDNRNSGESDNSSGRPGSRGFALDGQGHFEEDSFSGDGLEREKQWLEHFRERRGPRSRSSGQKDSNSSSSSSGSKDSSRYSFSTEFSSELDELYDQFSHWLEDPSNGEANKNGRNAAVFRFAHGLLKRTLSDSFASVAMNIENLSSQPETRIKDIKLSASSLSGGHDRRTGPKQRSWSLAEHGRDERLALQLAKEIVEQGAVTEEALPMPDIVPAVEVHQIQQQPEEPKKKSKLSGQLVSIVYEQSLADVELEVRGPRPRCHHQPVMRTQESLAWEYHQDPWCSFNVQLGAHRRRELRPFARQQSSQIKSQAAAQLRRQCTATTNNGQHLTTQRSTANPSPATNSAPKMPNENGVTPERVVRLLDRMSPVNDLQHNCDSPTTNRSTAGSCAGDDSDCHTPTPLNPTPPRTRRGSWFFKKSRDHRSHPQRARSNSVPTVMDVTQLTLWQQQLAERQKTSLIPDIIVSGENTEEDECFQPPAEAPAPQRRHRSYDDQLQNFAQSSESLLSDDVVEGFSWTMAETIIEDIMKEIGTKKTQLNLPERMNSKSATAKRKMPGKGILKISSNDSLNRSHSGSLEQPPSPICPVAKNVTGEHQQMGSEMSWSQRSTSMPSLRAVDESETGLHTSAIPCGVDECDSRPNQSDELKVPANHNLNGPLPIVTGNWGCGSRGGGDAQLKSMIQWMAASRSGAPYLMYYTAGTASVVKLDIVCRVIADRKWTVGDLAGAVLRYCRCRLDPRRLNLIRAASSSQQSSSLVYQQTSLSSSSAGERLLFDELLGPLTKQTEL